MGFVKKVNSKDCILYQGSAVLQIQSQKVLQNIQVKKGITSLQLAKMIHLD